MDFFFFCGATFSDYLFILFGNEVLAEQSNGLSCEWGWVSLGLVLNLLEFSSG